MRVVAAPMSSLLLLLAACAPPSATLSLPAVPPAMHASELEAARLLTPTTFGATSDILCPWARGETVPDASIARWVAEKRLIWRVLVLAPEATFGGLPIADAPSVAAAADALEARCGGLPPRDFLVAAGPDVPYGRVADGLYQLGKVRFDRPWLLVDAAGVTPVATSPTGLQQGGERDHVTLTVEDPPRVFGADGALLGTVEEALAQHPRCVIVAGSKSAAWGPAVALADAGRGSGGEVMLALAIGDGDDAGSTGVLPVPSGGRSASMHTRLPVLPIVEPTLCGESGGCGCLAATTRGAGPGDG